MNRQKGFTIVELVVALGISGLFIMLALQIYVNLSLDHSRNVNRLTANSDINQAITAIHQDLMVAQEISITDNLTTIEWTDYTGNQTDHVVTYGFNGAGSTILQRTYDGNLQIVGRNISDLTFTSNNSTITVVITSAGTKPTQSGKTTEISVKIRGEIDN
ncbi:type II secretion system protein J [Chloroflexota bacterium]